MMLEVELCLQTTFLLCQLISYKGLPRGNTKNGLQTWRCFTSRYFQMHTENLKKNQYLFLRQELFSVHHCTFYSWYLGEHCWCFPRCWQRKEPKEPFLFFLCFFGLPRCQICQLFRPSSNFLKSHYWLLIQR